MRAAFFTPCGLDNIDNCREGCITHGSLHLTPAENISVREEGLVELYNPNEKIGATVSYSTEDFPYTMQWKSMISGDYALGIEPATTRFDKFKMNEIAPRKEKEFKIRIDFK